MEREEDRESSEREEASDEEINFDDGDDEEVYCTSALLSKLQFRSGVSKAQWNEEVGMAEVVEKKGKMWITTGIVRGGKTFCSIEEALFLIEVGALRLVDCNDKHLSLNDMHGKIVEEKSGCCWELFEVYRHLKSLGYIVGRHNIPWTMKSVEFGCKSDSFHSNLENGMRYAEAKDRTCIVEMFKNLQVDDLRPVFDVYLPNSKFRKSSPGDPAFLLCLIRGPPPSCAQIQTLEKLCNGIPVKVCRVEYGRVTFISIQRVELPVLP